MAKEKSAGAIVFRIDKGEPLYLLLHYPSSVKAKREYWDLPKGHMEKGESEEETVRREVQEETGIQDIEIFEGFRTTIHYWFEAKGQKISKTVVFYLAKTKEQRIVISTEHEGFKWLPYEEALAQLTYKNAKEVVQKAHRFLGGRDAIPKKGV